MLYPVLKSDRDRIYAARSTTGEPPPPPEPKGNPTEVFHGLDEKQIHPTRDK
jgi:hypothetical protein